MGVSENSDHTQIKIKMLNPSQEPQASSKAQNDDFEDMGVLSILKIKIESHIFEHGYTKDQWPYPNQGQDAKLQSGSSSVLQSPNQDLKDIDVLCTFKIKIESVNSEHGSTKDQ